MTVGILDVENIAHVLRHGGTTSTAVLKIQHNLVRFVDAAVAVLLTVTVKRINDSPDAHQGQ